MLTLIALHGLRPVRCHLHVPRRLPVVKSTHVGTILVARPLPMIPGGLLLGMKIEAGDVLVMKTIEVSAQIPALVDAVRVQISNRLSYKANPSAETTLESGRLTVRYQPPTLHVLHVRLVLGVCAPPEAEEASVKVSRSLGGRATL